MPSSFSSPSAPPGAPPPPDPGDSLADFLEALPKNLPDEGLTLRQLLDAMGERSMASALLLLAFPQVLPIPLFLSNLLALPVVAVAAQMAVGSKQPWLPAWLLEKPVRRERIEQACRRVVPPMRRLERLVRPRLSFLWSHGNARLLGVACLLIALVALTPLPFTGWAPGWALLLVALGLLQRDGLVVLAGLALGVAAMGILAAVLAGLVTVGEEVATAWTHFHL